MNDPSLIVYIQNAIPNLVALYRFASVARSVLRPQSDIDLAILPHETFPEMRRFELAQELTIQLHREVDLVNPRPASTVMRMQVLSSESCLTSEDEQARREFEMYLYSD